MSTTQATPEQIKISLSKELKSLVRSRAEKIGIPVTQYVKNLIISDIKDYEIYQVSAKTEKRIGESLKDLKDGHYTVIKTPAGLNAYLDNI